MLTLANGGNWSHLLTRLIREGSRRVLKGSIYWFDLFRKYKILAFDLHTEEFRDVQVLPPSLHSTAARLVNLDDRLAIADICMMKPGWNLEIWIMDAQEETWSMTYSITLAHRFIPMHRRVIEEWSTMFTPLAVSKEGSLFFYDTKKRLFKYEPETDFLCCLSSDICVISPFVENLVRLHTGCVPKTRPPGCRNGRSCLNLVPGSRISKQIKLQIPNILLTSTLVSLICFGYSCTCRYCT
ncbi:BnaCnng34880D [Brassica napus]|uniref:BnaCnng34880D protein n=1 Tax=Brassica napus TaxID=3708 RepID=A0A078J5C9_BRANA|nr:BnaCnng34880D [Brassica napus]